MSAGRTIVSSPGTKQERPIQLSSRGLDLLTSFGGDPPSAEPRLSTSPVTSVSVGLGNETAYLLHTFCSGLATWMDLFDFNLSYQRDVCRRALQSRLVLHCICAFVAKHLSLLPDGAMWQPIASCYYGEALQRLITALNLPGPENGSDELVASILLGSYEVLSASREPHYSHYQGSLDLIRSRNINAATTGLDRANFFIYVRHDISIALARRQPLQLDPAAWAMPPLPSASVSEGEMGNHLLWITGRTINLIYGNDATCSLRQSLIDMVDEWYSRATETLRGFPYGDEDEDGLRKLFFAIPAAAAAITWYHLTRILLLAEPELLHADLDQNVQHHVKSILAIAASKIPAGVLSFVILPVYFGKHAVNISKKLRAYIMLKDIQSQIGQSTQEQRQSMSQLLSVKLE
ncbi:hypothetical protein F5B22DRAFT_649830 [Xylaria bambusicola]|uniref:uncharacterized protein n=1 Tax=Xylaria bambusicola TaxID=326684 RepID=UPI0020087053|nr:uncharacterized protein F5B22DRAFT_649830 [Xylaria bambusicola]KAI0508535.1 hypothetical protein F5B22DRAFT_649830 [Xylaria bambusicola]